MADSIDLDGWMSAQPDTPIAWFQERMAASGITHAIADKCGFALKMDDLGAHFIIPYFTVDTVPTTHRRQRNREERVVREPGVSGGNFRGKYTQPKRSKNHLYWPPIINQRVAFNAPSIPLVICEGELKSISCQSALMASGIGALVCGVPGTSMCETVREELLNINCIGEGQSRRIVYLAMDWNGRGQSRERSADLEYELKRMFQSLGAKVVMLRWEPTEGEQKLDDWLVAGGDISLALEHSLAKEQAKDTELAEYWDQLNETYTIMHGHYIPLSNLSQKYGPRHLDTMCNDIRLPVSRAKTLKASQIWDLQPTQDRNTVDSYVFHPAPLGHEVQRYIWEEGVRKLNTAPEHRWSLPPWLDEPPDVEPFIELLQYLCQEHWEWMADFLAHAAQRPLERGPHVVIFRDEGGTGKSRLFETLDLVFGKYSGPIGDSLISSFNAELEHLVIAWWSDPAIHGVDRDLESALKNFSGDSKIVINHKGGAKYTVRSYGRLMIATNKQWIVPFDSKERRFAVFGGLAPMTVAWAGEYMKWLDKGGVEQIRLYLATRDLQGFNVALPAPRTEQRIAMEAACVTPIAGFIRDAEEMQKKDLWTPSEICEAIRNAGLRAPSPTAVGMELKKLGAFSKATPIWVQKYGKVVRMIAVRNTEKWQDATNEEWVREFLCEEKGKKHE